MHASRVEQFDPPVWEEVQYTKNYFIYKFSIKDNYDFFGRITILKDFNIKVSGLVQGVLFEEYFNEAASKENYIKACTIARKLFLGESIEEEKKNEESKEACDSKKMYSIKPNIIEPDFSSLKKEISSGSIISYDMDYLSLNDLLLSFKVITSRGYEIEKLSTLLTE